MHGPTKRPRMTKQEFIEGSIGQLDLWGDHLRTMEEMVSERRDARGLSARIADVQRKKSELRVRLRRALGSKEARWERIERELSGALDDFRHRAQQVYRAVY